MVSRSEMKFAKSSSAGGGPVSRV